MPELAEEKTQITAVITKDLCAWLDKKANEERRSRSSYIAIVLDEYREEVEQKVNGEPELV